MRILVINGPNLNLLGHRDPAIYGTETLAHTLKALQKEFPDISFSFFQSNHEGDIIEELHATITGESPVDGIIINPGALAHYSYALADAMEALTIPAVEVHISNIFAREPHRHQSVTAPHAAALIAGCGRAGYSLAVRYLLSLPRPDSY